MRLRARRRRERILARKRMGRRLQLFYFSGTGNARHVARWMAETWRGHGLEAVERDLAGPDAATPALGPEDELGLVSPTHGFNMPPVTLRFLSRLPRAPRRNAAYVLNTRGGLRLFGRAIPGVSGLFHHVALLVLVWKGYRVKGARPVDLPSNWISLHPSLSAGNVAALYAKEEALCRRFAEKTVAGKSDYRAFLDLPLDLLVAPIAALYHFAGRFLLAKSFVATESCNGCRSCMERCPVRAIEWRDDRPFWTRRCENCMRCLNACPSRSIEAAHGFWFAALFGSYGLSSLLLAHAFRAAAPQALGPGFGPFLVRLFVCCSLSVALMSAAYGLLHRAMRWAPVAKAVRATSLTHLRAWRRYRAPKLRDEA